MSAGLLLTLRLLMAAALYAFLAYLLRQQMRLLHAHRFPSLPPLQLHLRRPDGRQEQHIFNRPDVLVGRAPDNHLTLDDPAVSAHHLLFRYRQGRWWVHDLGSRNGAFLNGARLETPAILVEDDTITLGACQIQIGALPNPAPQKQEMV